MGLQRFHEDPGIVKEVPVPRKEYRTRIQKEWRLTYL
jgi:hypothetical protein